MSTLPLSQLYNKMYLIEKEEEGHDTMISNQAGQESLSVVDITGIHIYIWPVLKF